MCTILVIDDEDDVRDGFSEELKLLGHVVFDAPDGAEALCWLREQPQRPCLILLDLRMPRMDGWDFLERLRLEESWADLPVVVLSATLRRGSDPPVIRAQAFWGKPPAPEQLQNIHLHCAQHGNPPLAPSRVPRRSNVV
jgi:CheY-like chemotaxis protein